MLTAGQGHHHESSHSFSNPFVTDLKSIFHQTQPGLHVSHSSVLDEKDEIVSD